MPAVEPRDAAELPDATPPDSAPQNSASSNSAPSVSAILLTLRVALHLGFAVLLAVAILRLHLGAADAGSGFGGGFGGGPVFGGGAPARYAFSGAALLLAGVYVAGTVVEKRFAEGASSFNPRRLGVPWLLVVTLIWAALLAGSPDFSWLAFPLFFLHLHLLPLRLALPAIAVMTAAVVASQWAGSGLPVPPLAAVLGPVVGAAFAVVMGLAYRALYREADFQRRSADELRRTRAALASTQHDAGVLAERERLAREIHDTLAQGLSSIVLVSRAAERSLEDGDAPAAAERMALVRQTASDNLTEARGFVRGLSAQLEESSLVDALRRLCRATEAQAAAHGSPLSCRLELDGDPAELPPPLAVALLRAAQSSLANVREHARADTAVVTLASLGTEVTLDVYDDGAGFDPAAFLGGPGGGADRAADAAPGTDGRGFGLRSLGDRAAYLGGTLNVESAPGEGTVVAVRLPLVSGAAMEGGS